MSNVNLNLYRIFCKVAQSKSYSEAAEKLGLSVPNISTQIANLEEQLDLKLFNRESKGVTLTENGRELYEIVNKSISSFDFAEKMAKNKNEIAKGNVKIGCPSHFTSYFLMERIEQVKKDFPEIDITVICEVDINKMLELLRNHEIDFAITDANIESNNIEVKELLTINNITTSFVLGIRKKKVCISGRSIGDINVQLILEKLGGGGHIGVAGAQITGVTLEEAKNILIEKIDEYFAEGTN